MFQEPTLRHLTDGNYGVPAKEQNILLQQLGAPHVSSFNFMTTEGLAEAVSDLMPIDFNLPSGQKIFVKISSASLSCPMIPTSTQASKKTYVLPTECRQNKSTYRGRIVIQIAWSIDDQQMPTYEKDMGLIPIMLKSNRCHLELMSPADLIKNKEHEMEWGGYFIVNGLERMARMLLMTRRNYPIAISRNSWKMRGNLFSEKGITTRCVKNDQTATTNVLHFVTDGSAKYMFSHRKNLYYVPLILILKCLCDYSDKYIYKKLIQGFEDDLYYSDCVENMLREMHVEHLHTSEECKAYMGKMFRVKFTDCPESFGDIEITDVMLERCILIHLNSNEDKFNSVIFMAQKLFKYSQDKCVTEGADAVMMQELLLGGHLYLQVLKDKLQSWLFKLKSNILLKASSTPNYVFNEPELTKLTKRSGNVQAAMESFLSSGNVKSLTGLGLMQSKGLTIVPENINRMRYMSHFKAVHRGSFFQEMRTTEARQLLPDAWGFICPVHTPDGAPCGLLNHLTMNCIVTETPSKTKLKAIPGTLNELGMVSINAVEEMNLKDYYCTQLDGRVIGYVHKDIATEVVNKLRLLKITGDLIPSTTEIGLIPFRQFSGQYPGLFLFTGPARMMRPLYNLAVQKIEFVGTFEQIYMEVCIKPEEIYKGVTTHMELSKTGFLSNLAQLIPMPDCNQSPRNMYQCQMGKQTMGTPIHTWDLQAETKLYRLQTPASPLFRPVHYDNIKLDDFAMGTNAVVAVVSYTGYDMEDAMIINKSSYERGFAHGSIYKSEFFELKHTLSYFERDPSRENLCDFLDTDGLPYIGRKVCAGEPIYSFYNADDSKYCVQNFKGKEDCYVNSVRLCGDFNPSKQKIACVTFRIPRNPSVGDKFASRAGQKGICSQKWPAEDLPFTESGLVPDIVFNPHGFPSRMTIAMMIELMAGKSGCLHGLVHDATPFRFTEKDTAIDYFARLLEEAGYNYYGTESMYSGIDGREMKVQVFFGIVHYQRLRHMVSDKWQVRSTGPTDVLTHQPIKGRKRGGGVRFGEMERDSLISHGASFLLQDRLLHCSDKTTVLVCTKCETILGPMTLDQKVTNNPNFSETKQICRFCISNEDISEIQVPYMFKFLVTEVASININLKVICSKV